MSEGTQFLTLLAAFFIPFTTWAIITHHYLWGYKYEWLENLKKWLRKHLNKLIKWVNKTTGYSFINEIKLGQPDYIPSSIPQYYIPGKGGLVPTVKEMLSPEYAKEYQRQLEEYRQEINKPEKPKKIVKYELQDKIEQTLSLSTRRGILSVNSQGGKVLMWVEHDPDAEPEDLTILMYKEGYEYSVRNKRFIGALENGNSITHVFQKWGC